MKWTEHWITRAQRKADARDERYRRRQAGEIPPGPTDGLIARRQAAFDRRQAQRDAALRRYPELTGYDEAYRLLDRGAPFRGPDGVEVAVWHAVSSKVWTGWPALPSRWRRSRVEWLFAVAGYFVSLPLKPMPFREIHSAYAYTMSGPPVRVVRHFPNYEEEAVLYAARLAKRVQAGGVEGLRQVLAAPSGQDGDGTDPLTW